MYATLKVAAEGLGIMSVLSDLGWRMRGEVWGDASAALGIIHRKGLGKTRHIETGHLWIQEIAAKERLKFKKVLGKDNPADLVTKYLDEQTTNHHIRSLEHRFEDGRAAEAPQLHLLSQSRDEHNEGRNVCVCEWLQRALNEVEIARGRAQGQRQRGKSTSSMQEYWK